ncbi:proline-specific permease [Diaporthe amygdali]|uniref:proline-specific permease n=1 Tax=Phomopsis amygdali TaxID=1214568 RepID=UPI0022FE3065|nr:proline-specific permease [Diaporthe amygdali]KAJ0123873.1 proline-specific permease [Diaporthe amygdali]
MNEDPNTTIYASNIEQFRDILSNALIEKIQKPERGRSGAKHRKRGKPTSGSHAESTSNNSRDTGPGANVEELSEFSEYIASIAFESLPPELQTITHRVWTDNPGLQEEYTLPLTSNDVAEKITPTLDPEVSESLTTYGILTPPSEDVTTFLAPVLTAYLTAVITPPPPASTTKGKVTECEICDRDWVPLTYHHLIPRFVHAKALKRGWHREEDLQNVAWLCRACHSFVHRFAGHEELARDYYTVERLLDQEEIQNFARWVGRVRWKAR